MNVNVGRFGNIFLISELKEENVTLILTMVDTPGFGDKLNREEE